MESASEDPSWAVDGFSSRHHFVLASFPLFVGKARHFKTHISNVCFRSDRLSVPIGQFDRDERQFG